jgi:hypothetical protein
MRLVPRFSEADAIRAFDEWGSNCGPGAIAVIAGMTLDAVRPYLGDFEAKRYTNPTLMWETLDRLGIKWRKIMRPKSWPIYGLARIQWEGPWTAPGVPPRVAYRHSHWVGVSGGNPQNVGIFDINAIGNGTGWCSLQDWSETLVPWILEQCEPGSNGRWYLTHGVEVERIPPR